MRNLPQTLKLELHTAANNHAKKLINTRWSQAALHLQSFTNPPSNNNRDKLPNHFPKLCQLLTSGVLSVCSAHSICQQVVPTSSVNSVFFDLFGNWKVASHRHVTHQLLNFLSFNEGNEKRNLVTKHFLSQHFDSLPKAINFLSFLLLPRLLGNICCRLGGKKSVCVYANAKNDIITQWPGEREERDRCIN